MGNPGTERESGGGAGGQVTCTPAPPGLDPSELCGEERGGRGGGRGRPGDPFLWEEQRPSCPLPPPCFARVPTLFPLLFTVQSPGGRKRQVRTTRTPGHTGSGTSRGRPLLVPPAPLLALAPPRPGAQATRGTQESVLRTSYSPGGGLGLLTSSPIIGLSLKQPFSTGLSSELSPCN